MNTTDLLNVAVDDDIISLVETGKTDEWQAGQLQLRRDLETLTSAVQKKMADCQEQIDQLKPSEGSATLTLRRRRSST